MIHKKFRYLIAFLSLLGQAFAQTGPAGLGTNDGSSSLKLWLDAGKGIYKDSTAKLIANADDRVYFWSDLSGNKNDVKSSFDSTRPTLVANSPFLNGQSALRFNRNYDNSNKRNYMSSLSFSKTNDITIYCVFYPYGGAGGNGFTPFKSAFLNLNFWYYGAGLVDCGVIGPFNDISMTICDTTLAAGGGDITTYTDFVVKTPLLINKPHFGVLQKEAWSGVMSIAKDGNAPAQYQTAKQPVNSPVKYFIGSTSDIAAGKDNTFFDGFMSSVMVFNKLLNQAEKTILENYLSARYDIEMPYNDLFKMDQAGYGNYDFDMAGIGKGTDASTQLQARGEGIIEISNATQLGIYEYLFWAHNGLPLTLQGTDIPEGLAQKLERTWRVGEVGEVGSVDLVVNTKDFTDGSLKDLVLLIDTDNDGQFADEQLGKGIIVYSKFLENGQYAFNNINLNDAQRFTFGFLEAACQTDCDATFSPNGDGQNDVYFLDYTGKTLIYDKYGRVVKEFSQPISWDGYKSNGELASPGLYFIVNTNGAQSTVTLIR